MTEKLAHPAMEAAIRRAATQIWPIPLEDRADVVDAIYQCVLPALETEIAQAVAGAYRAAADKTYIQILSRGEESCSVARYIITKEELLALTPAHAARERQRERLQDKLDTQIWCTGANMDERSAERIQIEIRKTEAALAALDAPQDSGVETKTPDGRES